MQTARYLGRISVAGAISCSATHSLVVPLDVIKTRMQTNSDLTSVREAVRAILASGPGKGPLRAIAFFKGFGATAAGYWLQGAAKFGARAAAALRVGWCWRCCASATWHRCVLARARRAPSF